MSDSTNGRQPLSKLMIFRLKLFATLTILVGVVGALDAYRGPLSGEHALTASMYLNGANHLLGGALLWGFEIFFVHSRYGVRLRRLNFLMAIVCKSAILICVVIFSVLLGRLLLHQELTLVFLAETEFYKNLGHLFLVVIVIQVVIQIIRIVGGRNLLYFILGRYNSPVTEDRIFMFLDIADSTAAAERMGDIGVQSMITKFFFDITEPIIEYGGEIHRYVGDQVVVTWPLLSHKENTRVIECCCAIAAHIQDKSQEYERDFGTVPAYQIGLHGGPVVISQCGDYKQEISYFGDTVNTAARIERQCKKLDAPILISGELLSKTLIPPNIKTQPLGEVQLRGRTRKTELFAVLAA